LAEIRDRVYWMFVVVGGHGFSIHGGILSRRTDDSDPEKNCESSEENVGNEY